MRLHNLLATGCASGISEHVSGSFDRRALVLPRSPAMTLAEPSSPLPTPSFQPASLSLTCSWGSPGISHVHLGQVGRKTPDKKNLRKVCQPEVKGQACPSVTPRKAARAYEAKPPETMKALRESMPPKFFLGLTWPLFKEGSKSCLGKTMVDFYRSAPDIMPIITYPRHPRSFCHLAKSASSTERLRFFSLARMLVEVYNW